MGSLVCWENIQSTEQNKEIKNSLHLDMYIFYCRRLAGELFFFLRGHCFGFKSALYDFL